MKKTDDFEKLLDKIVEFGNEGDKKKLPKLLFAICRASSGLGFHYNLTLAESYHLFNFVDPPAEQKCILIRERIREVLLDIVDDEDEPTDFEPGSHNADLWRGYPFKTVDPDWVIKFSDGPDGAGHGIADMMVYIMFFLGITEVRKCLNCENYL